MNKRVFHVDQECFLIYAEELSNKKERFLRIGNSPFLKEVEKDLTFITLLSEILPGDPLKEIEIFKKDKHSRIIGLKKIVAPFIEFLKNNKINTDNIKSVIAEKERDLTSEKDFINKIEKNNSMRNHSFASFYGDGNVKIFNRSEIIFDLLEGLRNTTDINNEIKLASNFFKSGYMTSYQKNGLILSGKSLFVFSNNSFACITDSKTWGKDAARVGISPNDVELLYISKNTSTNDIFIKPLLTKNTDKKSTLISKEKPTWLPLVQGKNIKHLDPLKDKVNYKIGNIGISFLKEKIKIFSRNISLTLNSEESFLDKSAEISVEYQTKTKKTKSSFIIEDYKKEALTLYKFNPLIFEDSINKSDYIKTFWNNFPDVIKNEEFGSIIKDDDQYNDYSPDLKKKSFYSKLFSETIRRINYEDNKNIDETVLDSYKNLLSKFSGELINENSIIIEQIIGGNSNNKISIRDTLANKNFIYLSSEINPFINLKNDETREKWEAKLKKYRESYKKNVNDEDKEKAIRERFTEISESKRFYIEEQNRLKRFIDELILKERQKENQKTRNEKIETPAIAKESKTFDNKQEKAADKMSIQTKLKNKKAFNFLRGKGKKIKLPIIIITILVLILIVLALLLNLKPTKSNFKKFVINKMYKKEDKKEIETKNEDSYKVINNYNDRKIIEINIKISIIDVLNFTNLVAEKNGYHEIVDEEKKELIAGKDPNWIFPENTLILPDETKIVIKENDNMWNLSEDFLIKEAKAHEALINEILFDYKKNKIDLNSAKEKLKIIKSESHLNNLKKAIDDLLKMDDLGNITASM